VDFWISFRMAGRIYDEVKDRPMYVIKEKIGFNYKSN